MKENSLLRAFDQMRRILGTMFFKQPLPGQTNWRIARTILTQYPHATAEAKIHILRAWYELADCFQKKKGLPLHFPPDWRVVFGAANLPFSKELPQEEWFADLERFAAARDNKIPDRLRLLLHCRLLEDTIFERTALFVDIEPLSMRQQCWRSFVAVCSLLAVLLFLYFWTSSLKVWRSELFTTTDLDGEPVAVRASAYPVVPTDKEGSYSKRWDTCMRVDKSGRVLFEIGSDDGSRLFVDGRLLIDNWRDQSFHREQQNTTLHSGWHHLRLEYYQRNGPALVSFRAWRLENTPGAIAPKYFRYPSHTLPEPNPCLKFDSKQ